MTAGSMPMMLAARQGQEVGPGTGTAAALFAAAAYPDRLRSLVVGSGVAAVPLELGGLLPQIRTPVQIIVGAHDKVVPRPMPSSFISGWWAGGHEAASRTPVKSLNSQIGGKSRMS